MLSRGFNIAELHGLVPGTHDDGLATRIRATYPPAAESGTSTCADTNPDRGCV